MKEDIETRPGMVCGFAVQCVLQPDKQGIIDAMHEVLQAHPQNPLKKRFPGPNPCSIERRDFATLKKTRYFVCEKTDGVRHLFLCVRYKGHNVAALLNRSLDVFLVTMRALPRVAFQGSVFDGEIVQCKQSKTWRFLVFDAVVLSACPVFANPLSYRITKAHALLGLYKRDPLDSFSIFIKQFIPSHDETAVRRQLERAKNYFEVDGLIFTPEDDPVIFGRAPRLFKYKEKHSVDFVYASQGQTLSIFDTDQRKLVAVARLGNTLAGTADSLKDGDVVECVPMCLQENTWKLICVRRDKPGPNDKLTYTKTCLNQKEAITLQEILQAAAAL